MADASLNEIETAVEQLRVAEEELRVQNDELNVQREAADSALQRYQDLFEHAPDPYLTTDPHGVIREANSAAVRLLNVPNRMLRGKPFSAFVPTGHRRAFRVGLNRIAAGQEPSPGSEEWAVQIRPRRGSAIEVAVTATRLQGPTGKAGSIRWMLRDVTSRRRAEAEVRRLNSELEERVIERTAALEAANWAKAEFLSVMAHELRTPLNAIIGYTELLDMGISGPVTDIQKLFLQRIRGSGQRLVGLVNEVLDLGKVEAGELRVVREECNIADAIETSLGIVLPQAAARAIRITSYCQGPEPFHYLGDQNRVEQILLNLLSNAVKFTEPGGDVEITCLESVRPLADIREYTSRSTWLALKVRDTGIGMSADAVTKVFEPFVQVERPLTRTQGGTGLGLTISRRLARLMGGDLTVDSELGFGSTFTLWLPAAESAVVTPEELERRAPARYAKGIAILGTLLLEQIDAIVRAYARRLKAKNGIAKARGLSKSELEDHAAAFLADIVQALVAVEEADGGPSSIMRDGSVLRRIISERHGAQRHRLGWTEDELSAEFKILGRAVDEAAKKTGESESSSPEGIAAMKAARTVLARLLDTAEEISLRGFRLAGMEELQNNRLAD